MNLLRVIRVVTWTAIAAIAAGTAAIYFLGPGNGGLATSISGKAAIGGPFSLVSHKGERVSNETLRGKPYLAFSGFTNCPHICPTTLFELSDMIDELGADFDEFNVLLISVDPERDSQELLATYMTAFDPRILALRGTRKETDAVVKSFAAAAIKVPLDGGNYTMEHTAGVYLMDENGEYAGLMRMDEPREQRMQALRDLAG
ncbi:SCO family protein [Manganibacter manganicus]|uniref:Copper-binding protein n=1 Tax=Manganibacter manganicus TaxID=1873176 RepID=A0A1V8RRD2_9HYPH|nr:SCO family protein [Pseudaminobacter manganicus]OQM75684.1 copper-binding protein [Pseudaminobacter manganicus]